MNILRHKQHDLSPMSMTALRRLPFTQFDVFTSRALEGNPLAVFPDGRSLNDDEMQAIAKEMNLSETTYILPRDSATEKERGIRVRIFTVQEELPFAGHPTLGTAFALRGNSGAAEIRLELNVGTIPVLFEEKPGHPAFGEMRQKDPVFGQIHDVKKIAEVTGIPLADIDSAFPVQTISTGVPFTILPLRGLEQIRRLEINQLRSAEYLSASGGKFFFCVSRETVDPQVRLHARMLFYNGEDPCNGLSFRLRRSVDGATRNC